MADSPARVRLAISGPGGPVGQRLRNHCELAHAHKSGIPRQCQHRLFKKKQKQKRLFPRARRGAYRPIAPGRKSLTLPHKVCLSLWSSYDILTHLSGPLALPVAKGLIGTIFRGSSASNNSQLTILTMVDRRYAVHTRGIEPITAKYCVRELHS